MSRTKYMRVLVRKKGLTLNINGRMKLNRKQRKKEKCLNNKILETVNQLMNNTSIMSKTNKTGKTI